MTACNMASCNTSLPCRNEKCRAWLGTGAPSSPPPFLTPEARPFEHYLSTSLTSSKALPHPSCVKNFKNLTRRATCPF